MCGCDSYDGPTVFRATMRRARKAHRCSECGAPIAVGELYVDIFGVWDGFPDSFLDCRKCDALRQAWHDTEGCWPSHGNLRDDVFECLREEVRPEYEQEDWEPTPAHAVNLAFGVNYRRRLGRMGPRRAA